MPVNTKTIDVKSLLTKSNLPEADFVINPYIGCQHACIYCYADFMKRFTGHSNEKWGEFVDVKINAPDLLKIKTIPENSSILFGSVTDPYQPAEAKYFITKKCLEKLIGTNAQIEILTKSPLVLRDIDLFKKFKNLKVGISLGILDEDFSLQLEPFTSTPLQRIEALKKLNKQGIKTYLFISPIFPEISEINKTLDLVKNYVDEVFFENLNIRGNNKQKIINFIKNNKPNLEELYENLPKNKVYWNNLKEDIIRECKIRNLKYKIFFNHCFDSS